GPLVRLAELRAERGRADLREPRPRARRARAGECRWSGAAAPGFDRRRSARARLGAFLTLWWNLKMETVMKRIISMTLLLAGAALLAGCPKKPTVSEPPTAQSQVPAGVTTGA